MILGLLYTTVPCQVSHGDVWDLDEDNSSEGGKLLLVVNIIDNAGLSYDTVVHRAVELAEETRAPGRAMTDQVGG